MLDDVIEFGVQFGGARRDVSLDECLESSTQGRVEERGRDRRENYPNQRRYDVTRYATRAARGPYPAVPERRSDHWTPLFKCSCISGCNFLCFSFKES